MPNEPVNIFEYEDIAKRKLDKAEYDFITGGTTDARGGRHLGVERLDLRGPPVHEQEDDSLIADSLPAGSRGFTTGDQVGQRQATQAQATDLQEVAATVAAMSVVDVQHRRLTSTLS